MATVDYTAASQDSSETGSEEMDAKFFVFGTGAIWAEKGRSLKWVEFGVGFLLLAVAIISANILLLQGPKSEPLEPYQAAMLLVANLLPATAMLVLIGRRMALKRAAQNPIVSREMIHVRLVAIFSLIAGSFLPPSFSKPACNSGFRILRAECWKMQGNWQKVIILKN